MVVILGRALVRREWRCTVQNCLFPRAGEERRGSVEKKA
jgi:hypothetical protein